MIENKYIEYSKWAMVWGLFLSSEKEIQKFMTKYNKDGWRVVQFQWTAPKWTIGHLVKILAITVVSLGFVSYWSGFSIIFEREAVDVEA